MQITRFDIHALRMGFDDHAGTRRTGPRGWKTLETVLVCLETADGVQGWGEAFAYDCAATVATCLAEMVKPRVLGQQVTDIATFTRGLQKALHIQGRYGLTQFALSGVDIALWDLAAKSKGVALAALLARDPRTRIPAYASLVRYGDPGLATEITAAAVADGFGLVKLHEVTPEAIGAARAAAPLPVALATDVNCAWTPSEAAAVLTALRPLHLAWVEEPVFPPEDHASLRELGTLGTPLAAGENACTVWEFRRLAEVVAIAQPSVTKIGGISEFVATCEALADGPARLIAHAPYFGPGYWATVQLCAARPELGPFEFLYVRPDAWLDPTIPLPRAGEIAVPDRAGLGFTPDPAVLARFAIA